MLTLDTKLKTLLIITTIIKIKVEEALNPQLTLFNIYE